VTVSLAQTSVWYLRLGCEPDPTGASGIGDVAPLLDTRATPWGAMTYVRPALRMPETPPEWALPSAPPGSGSAAWA